MSGKSALCQQFATALSLMRVDPDRGFVVGPGGQVELTVLWRLASRVLDAMPHAGQPETPRETAAAHAAVMTMALVEITRLIAAGKLAGVDDGESQMLQRFYRWQAELLDHMRLGDTGQPVPDNPGQMQPPGPRFTEVHGQPDPADAYPDDWSNPPAPDLEDWQRHQTHG